MAQGRESIEQEMDEVRQHLAGTIDQLLHRTSPKTIASRQAASVKGYFVAEDGPRTDNIVKVVGGAMVVLVVLGVIRRVVR